MPKKKAIRLCTVDVPYPMKAYVLTLLITSSTGDKIIWPLMSLQKDYEDIAESLHEFRKNATDQELGITIPDLCFVLPVTFSRRYPLRREFWRKPTNPYTTAHRFSAFLHAMDKPSLYSLLVTPSENGKDWLYMAALPFLNSTPEVSIEQFMRTSDWPVAEKAKHAAIYTFSSVIIYDWVQKREEDVMRMRQDPAGNN